MRIDHLQLYSDELARVTRDALPDSGTRGAEIDEAFLQILDALSLGRPFTFLEQHGGEIVQNIRPVRRHEAERSSRGRLALDLHTDDAFLPGTARVEYIALCGVSNPARVPTQMVRLRDVCERLQRETIEALSQPVFSFGCPQSYDIDDRETIWTLPQPILKAAEGGAMEVSLPSTEVRVGAEAASDVAQHLARFKAALANAPRRQVELDAGEIVVISNSRCLHGRPPVEAERWLKRVYLRRDLSALDEAAGTEAPGVYSAAEAFRHDR